MKIRIIYLILLAFFITFKGMSQELDTLKISSNYQFETSVYEDTSKIIESENTKFKYRESKRFVAALLCLSLGPFGMHRLYLGSTPQVAAAYSVTLGAIGIVPVIDLMLITFSKDISRFKNNGKVIMWLK